MQRVLYALSPLAISCLIFVGGGCSLMKPRDSALADYERTRQQLAGGGPLVEAAQYSEEVETEDGLTLSDLSPDNVGSTVRRLSGNGPQSTRGQTAVRSGSADLCGCGAT